LVKQRLKLCIQRFHGHSGQLSTQLFKDYLRIFIRTRFNRAEGLSGELPHAAYLMDPNKDSYAILRLSFSLPQLVIDVTNY